ncbi:MAG: hypothetical protein Q9223_007245 [Gallowayella weberi]
MRVVKGQLYQTNFGFFDYQRVSFGPNRNGSGITRRVALEGNDNGNEARDYDSGGPHKVCIMPVRLGNEPYMFLDATVPIRAVYFPLAHVCSEALPNICSYIMVDFRLRDELRLWRGSPSWDPWVTIPLRDTLGMETSHWRRSIGFDLQGIYYYLSLPRQLRHPDQGLYNAKRTEDILIYVLDSVAVQLPRGLSEASMKQRETKVAFNREMDLARVVSANLGVNLVWAPYQYSSFLFDLFTSLTESALGFIPVVGPLLAFGFSITVSATTDPDLFRSDNILGLHQDLLEAIIDSGTRSRKYMTPGFSFSNTGKKSSTDLEAYKGLISSMKEQVERDDFRPSAMFAARLENLDDCAGHEPGFRRQPSLIEDNDQATLEKEQADGAHDPGVSAVVLRESQQPAYTKASVKVEIVCELHKVKEYSIKFD